MSPWKWFSEMVNIPPFKKWHLLGLSSSVGWTWCLAYNKQNKRKGWGTGTYKVISLFLSLTLCLFLSLLSPTPTTILFTLGEASCHVMGTFRQPRD
jgi:hypothetical protein